MLYCINTSILLLKYFCRVDDYGVKSKLAFEVAHAGYRNQQESLRLVQLQPPPVEVMKQQWSKLLKQRHRSRQLHKKVKKEK